MAPKKDVQDGAVTIRELDRRLKKFMQIEIEKNRVSGSGPLTYGGIIVNALTLRYAAFIARERAEDERIAESTKRPKPRKLEVI